MRVYLLMIQRWQHEEIVCAYKTRKEAKAECDKINARRQAWRENSCDEYFVRGVTLK